MGVLNEKRCKTDDVYLYNGDRYKFIGKTKIPNSHAWEYKFIVMNPDNSNTIISLEDNNGKKSDQDKLKILAIKTEKELANETEKEYEKSIIAFGKNFNPDIKQKPNTNKKKLNNNEPYLVSKWKSLFPNTKNKEEKFYPVVPIGGRKNKRTRKHKHHRNKK